MFFLQGVVLTFFFLDFSSKYRLDTIFKSDIRRDVYARNNLYFKARVGS
jgi:hypothetical protein